MSDTPFVSLAQLGEQLEQTSKRRELTSLLAGFLHDLDPAEVLPAARLTIKPTSTHHPGGASQL